MKADVEIWGDITERFEIVEDEHLVYMDGPWEGLLRSKETGELFAFRISVIVDDLLWHWVLLPVASAETSVEAVFEAASSNPPERWISVIEDARGPAPHLYASRLSAKQYKVPAWRVEPTFPHVEMWTDAARQLATLDAIARKGTLAFVKVDGLRERNVYTVVVTGGFLGEDTFRTDGSDLRPMLEKAIVATRADRGTRTDGSGRK